MPLAAAGVELMVGQDPVATDNRSVDAVAVAVGHYEFFMQVLSSSNGEPAEFGRPFRVFITIGADILTAGSVSASGSTTIEGWNTITVRQTVPAPAILDFEQRTNTINDIRSTTETVALTLRGGFGYRLSGSARCAVTMIYFAEGDMRCRAVIDPVLTLDPSQPDADQYYIQISPNFDLAAEIRDINPGPGRSIATPLLADGDRAWLVAGNPDTGLELWVSDGNEADTRLVRDINQVTGFNPSFQSSGGTLDAMAVGIPRPRLVKLGDHVYFAADDGVNGGGLWRSDGTTDGTSLVLDPRPDFDGSTLVRHLTVVGDRLFFTAPSPGSAAFVPLWSSDGSTHAIHRDMDTDLLTASADKLFFMALVNGNGNNRHLWVTDANPADTRPLTPTGGELLQYLGAGAEFRIVDFARNDAPRVLFTPSAAAAGIELWVSDGTSAGTHLLQDIHPGTDGKGVPNHSLPRDFARLSEDTMLFSAVSDLGIELWKTDGSSAGTALVKDIRPGPEGSLLSGLAAADSKVYFAVSATGDPLDGEYDLWESDGSSAGTQRLLQLEAKEIRDITPIDHRFAFVARRDQLELWLSDGTAEGSRVILATDPDEGLIDDLLVTGTHLLFGANKIVQESADDFPDWPAHIPRIENHGHELYGFPLIPAPRGASTGGDVLLADGFE